MKSGVMGVVCVAAMMWATGCASIPDNAPAVVSQVDLSRYLGTWYEQGHKPLRPQKGCYGTTATYAPGEGDEITVLNRCFDGGWGEEPKEAKGRAWVVDKSTNAKLKVQFFWPFSGDYWIIGLDEQEYQWAVVGSPDRDNLWLLTRQPVISRTRYEELLDVARAKGFDVEDVIRTPQREVQEL